MNIRFDKIVVAVDFSAGSRRAVELAKALARIHAGEVVLVHAWQPPLYPRPAGDAFLPEPSLMAGLAEAAEAAMQLELREVAEAGVRMRGRVAMGEASQLVSEEAESMHADIVVVGTHGRGGLARLFLGSVAERIVRTAPVPVLTVR